MAGKKEYEAKAEALLEPIAAQTGVSIYDVEYVKEAGEWYLRAYIDKEGGVTIEDCETVSRAFSDVLDREDFIEDAYIMEISSPGLGRQLKKDRHFQNSLGQEIEVKLFEALDGQKELEGTLEAFDKEKISLRTGEKLLELERKKLALVRLKLNL